jgi:hypothetical protein
LSQIHWKSETLNNEEILTLIIIYAKNNNVCETLTLFLKLVFLPLVLSTFRSKQAATDRTGCAILIRIREVSLSILHAEVNYCEFFSCSLFSKYVLSYIMAA